MTADYSAEIKIVIFQSVLEWRRDEWRSSSNFGRIAAKIARFNSENSKIVGRKFTKFGCDVAWLLRLYHLKADLRSANPLSNAKAKSKGRFPRRRLYNLMSEPNLTRFLQGVQKWLLITLLKSKSRFNSVNSQIIGWKITKFGHDVPKYYHLIFWKRIYDRPIRCRTPKRGVKVVGGEFCDHPLNLTGCHSNVPSANTSTKPVK